MVSCKVLVLAAIVALASAQQGGHHYHHDHHVPAHYQFAYSVHDPHTHDIKEQHETREGDKVQGYYSLVEPDGTKRIVHYTADKHNGFQARVERTGHAVHPQVQHHNHHQANVHYGAQGSQGGAGSSHHAATSHISFNNHGHGQGQGQGLGQGLGQGYGHHY